MSPSHSLCPNRTQQERGPELKEPGLLLRCRASAPGPKLQFSWWAEQLFLLTAFLDFRDRAFLNSKWGYKYHQWVSDLQMIDLQTGV